MSVKLYYDLLTPASRSIYMFLKINNIPFQSKQIDTIKGEHLTNEFKTITKLNQIPVLSLDGFNLIENAAMIRYLSKHFPISEHWYPKDSVKQAKIDEFLSWEHHNTGFLCYIYHNLQFLKPKLTGKPPVPEKIEPFKYRLVDCMDKLEEIWLNDNKFLTGENITVADIQCINDLDQAIMAGYDPTINRPRLTSWMDSVKDYINPHYEEVVKLLRVK